MELSLSSSKCKGITVQRGQTPLCIPDEPLVSVIIPVYNVSRYLPKCLDSVISQTWRNLEIIVIDDGSTDGSGSICDQYAKRDDRIKVIHSPNRGLSSARNLGLDNLRGQFISFIDSDDWIEPDAVETLVKAALLTGSYIVTAWFCREYVGKTVHTSTRTDNLHVYRGRDILPAFIEGRFRNEVWNKLYSVECFANIRFPDGYNYEDIAITWKLLQNMADNDRSVTALPDELVHFRVRKSSISHTWNPGNLSDNWIAKRVKYESLPDYKEILLAGCFVPILRMWADFIGYSKEEKAESEKTIREMHAFSKKHFAEVLKGKYPVLTKITCLLSQSRSAPVMWISFCGGKLWRGLKIRKYTMFD